MICVIVSHLLCICVNVFLEFLRFWSMQCARSWSIYSNVLYEYAYFRRLERQWKQQTQPKHVTIWNKNKNSFYASIYFTISNQSGFSFMQLMKTNWDASEKHLSGQLDQMVRHSVRMHFCKMSSPKAYQRCWPIGCTVHVAVHKRESHSRSCCVVWCYWRVAQPMKKSSKFNKLSTYYKLV